MYFQLKLLNDWIRFFTDEVKAYITDINLNYINNMEKFIWKEAPYLEAKGFGKFNKALI